MLTTFKRMLWLNVVLLLSACILFLEGIVDNPLWFDEAWSVDVARTTNYWERIQHGFVGLHPPLFYTLQHYNPWLVEQLFTPRLLSVFATILAVAMTYRLASDLFGRKAGLVAASLVLTSDLVIGLAPLIRHYNLYMLWSIVATWLYWRYFQRWNWRWGLAYGLAGVAMIYTLYWGGFILIAHGIHTLIYRPRRLHYMLIVALFIGLLFAPWFPRFLETTTESETGYHSALDLDEQGLDIMAFHLFGIPYNVFIFLSIAGMAGTLGASQWRGYLPNEKTTLIGLWLFLPLAIPIISDLLLDYGLLNHRSLVGMVPALSILIAHVLIQLRGWVFNLFFALLMINNLTTTGSNGPPLGPWWEVGDAIADCAGPHDLVVIESDDILQRVMLEQHAELAGIAHDAIYQVEYLTDVALDQIEARVQQDRSVGSICWVAYLDHEELGPGYLEGLGFVQTAPPRIFPQESPDYDETFIVLDQVDIWHYSRQTEADPEVQFGDVLALLAAEHFQRGDHLSLNTLWMPQIDLDTDYTLSAFLLSADGVLVSQHDSYPLEGRSPTSQWEKGKLYSDRRQLDIQDLPSGTYQLGLQIYSLQDGQNLPTSPCAAEGCRFIILDSVEIKAD